MDVRSLDADSSDFLPALHLAQDLRLSPEGQPPAPPVRAFLEDIKQSANTLEMLHGAYLSGKLVGAVAAIVSPGRSALVLLPSKWTNADLVRVYSKLLESLKEAAWERSLILLQTLTRSSVNCATESLQQSGFQYLTNLDYLRYPVQASPARTSTVDDLAWVTYSGEREKLFQEALEQTYAQSLDCPELTSIRSTSDVLAGHRAAGLFEARFWWVAMRGDRPAGVMLLSRIPRSSVMEVVYMGVAQPFRRTGVAHALLSRALLAAQQESVTGLALAVDSRNVPARSFYRRWGFIHATSRGAWICQSPG